MKWTLALAFVLTIPATTQATIITYEITDLRADGWEIREDGSRSISNNYSAILTGHLSFDLETQSVVSAGFKGPGFDVSGTGSSPYVTQFIHEYDNGTVWKNLDSDIDFLPFPVRLSFELSGISAFESPVLSLVERGVGGDGSTLVLRPENQLWVAYRGNFARVPEPGTLSLLAFGLAAIGIRRRLR